MATLAFNELIDYKPFNAFIQSLHKKGSYLKNRKKRKNKKKIIDRTPPPFYKGGKGDLENRLNAPPFRRGGIFAHKRGCQKGEGTSRNVVGNGK